MPWEQPTYDNISNCAKTWKSREALWVLQHAEDKKASGEIDYYIIVGDFNFLISGTYCSEYEAIIKRYLERGCSFANNKFIKTWWGWWSSYDGNKYAGEECDNIIVSKGLKIDEFAIDYTKIELLKADGFVNWDYIDHLPIIAKISIA